MRCRDAACSIRTRARLEHHSHGWSLVARRIPDTHIGQNARRDITRFTCFMKKAVTEITANRVWPLTML